MRMKHAQKEEDPTKSNVCSQENNKTITALKDSDFKVHLYPIIYIYIYASFTCN